MVFFTVMACLPLMLAMIGLEKEHEELAAGRVAAHRRALPFFICLFLGLIIAFAFWFVVLPESVVANLFKVQIDTIRQISASVAGGAFTTGYFTQIFANNLKVLTFCVLFSFIYGAGAVFILTWNASVIGTAIGNSVRGALASLSGLTGLAGAAGYFHVFSLGLLRYLIHGIPEITGYFLGGLAGGMISVAVIKHQLSSENFAITLRNAMALVFLAVLCLIAAVVLEVFVSPAVPI